jgi:putative heme transporter
VRGSLGQLANAFACRLEPLIVGRQVRLHPIAIVTAVFAGSLTAGIAGAVIAVPLVAVTYRVYRVLHRRSHPARR